MIPVFLRQMLPRMLIVLAAAIGFGMLEGAFHQHETGPVPADVAPYFSAVGLAASLANLAGLAVLVLLAGFISADRRRGYHRMYFAHPTRPLSFYGVKWALGVLLAVAAAAAFLVLGQVFAWGEFRGGFSGLFLAVLSAVAYGGLMAFLSAALPRGDAWVAVGVFFVAYFWGQILSLGAEPLPPAIRDAVSLILPPQSAMAAVYEGLIRGAIPWSAAGFVAGYGLFWLVLAGLLVKYREWP